MIRAAVPLSKGEQYVRSAWRLFSFPSTAMLFFTTARGESPSTRTLPEQLSAKVFWVTARSATPVAVRPVVSVRLKSLPLTRTSCAPPSTTMPYEWLKTLRLTVT